MKRAVSVFLSCIFLIGILFAFPSCTKKQKERTRYEIVAEYKPADGAFAGTVKVDFYNAYDVEVDCLKFQLYPNAYRKNAAYSPIGYDVMTEAYYQGQSDGEINVSSVLGCANFEIGGEDKNVLYAYLAQPIPPESRIILDIGFTTKLATVNHRLGIAERAVNFAGAFPILCAFSDGEQFECVYSSFGEPFFAECADYSLTLTLPKEYTLACGGFVTEERILESKKRYTVSAVNVRELAFSISSEYVCAEAETGKTKIRFYHFREDDAEKLTELARRAVEYYSAAFGEYPYDTLAIARTGLTRSAAVHSGVCLLSNRLSDDELIKTLLESIAEIWWYAGVGVNRVKHAWLTEGLSAYSAAHFFDKYPEYGLGKKVLTDRAREEYLKFKDSYNKALGWVDTRMDRDLKTFLNVYEYDCVMKHKAVAMLADLEKSIGAKKMASGLRRYYAENLYGTATPASFVGAFERCGLDVGGFVEGYTAGKGTF